jgi:Transcriptional Coactivator p15 (PC4)
VTIAEAAAEPVYTWPKNSREEYRATLSEFKGHELADIRVYVADEDDVDHPTRKGLSVKVSDLPRLREAVDALIEAAA